MIFNNKKVTLEINHKGVELDTNLDVGWFSIGGRVVDSQGNPLEDIDISLDGQKKTKTRQDGTYTIT